MTLREIWSKNFVAASETHAPFLRQDIRRADWNWKLCITVSEEGHAVLVQQQPDDSQNFGMPWACTAEDMAAEDWEAV